MRRRRAHGLKRVRLYLALYPGGTHRDEAIRLELETLYELGALRGGDLSELCRAATGYSRNAPSRVAEEEAAYWLILCARSNATDGAGEPASQPATGPLRKLDAASVAAMRDYINRYPKSRYVPRLAALLFDWAARRGDRECMLDLVKHVGTHFPHLATTKSLLGRWNRAETLGRPFHVDLSTPDGRRIRARDLLGRPALIVVWAGYDVAARDCAAAIEQYRQAHPELQTIGVSLEEAPAATRAACTALGIEWPQVSDGRGWGGDFVRTWGVREIPFVFVLDRGGRLLGCATDGRWRELADAALGLPATAHD